MVESNHKHKPKTKTKAKDANDTVKRKLSEAYWQKKRKKGIFRVGE